MAPFLCPSCIGEFIPFSPPFCETCGILFKSREGKNRICGQCLESPRNPFIGKARSVGPYDTVLIRLIQAFKYHYKIQLAGPFSRLLLRTLWQNWNSGDVDMIIPVPLHRNKARRRGFNQSWLMISRWPGSTPSEFDTISVIHDGLVRTRSTAPQTGLSRIQREENIKNAFEVPNPGRVKSKRIILVDDVFTTGATLNECARVLLKAGALRVDALTMARAL
jgi:ComF family protein